MLRTCTTRYFDSAWQLTGKAPTTELWARLLGHLSETVKPSSPAALDIMAVIDRWRLEVKKEKLDSSDLSLDPFLRLKFLWTQLISKPSLAQLCRHEDIVMRSGFYWRCEMNTQTMREGFAADGQFFLDNALYNESVWRDAPAREVLRELCWAEKRMDMWYQTCTKASKNTGGKDTPTGLQRNRQHRRRRKSPRPRLPS